VLVIMSDGFAAGVPSHAGVHRGCLAAEKSSPFQIVRSIAAARPASEIDSRPMSVDCPTVD
jgi:hypothetical protein